MSYSWHVTASKESSILATLRYEDLITTKKLLSFGFEHLLLNIAFYVQ